MDGIALAVLGLTATIAARIAGLAYWLGRELAAIGERFREMDRRPWDVDDRFEGLGRGLGEEIGRAVSIVASTVTARTT